MTGRDRLSASSMFAAVVLGVLAAPASCSFPTVEVGTSGEGGAATTNDIDVVAVESTVGQHGNHVLRFATFRKYANHDL